MLFASLISSVNFNCQRLVLIMHPREWFEVHEIAKKTRNSFNPPNSITECPLRSRLDHALKLTGLPEDPWKVWEKLDFKEETPKGRSSFRVSLKNIGTMEKITSYDSYISILRWRILKQRCRRSGAVSLWETVCQVRGLM